MAQSAAPVPPAGFPVPPRATPPATRGQWKAGGCADVDRRRPRPGLDAALPAAATPGRGNGVPHLGDVAAHQSPVLPFRASHRLAAGRRGPRAGGAALLRAPRRRDRPHPRSGPGEPVPDRVHHRPRLRRGVLAIPPHPQTVPPPRAHPHRPRRRHQWAGDRRRLPRAVPLPLHPPTGHHRETSPALRRLRAPHRRDTGGLGGTEIPRRPRRQPHQRHTALRPGRTRRPTPRRPGGRGPLLRDLQTRPGPPRHDRRRTRRAPDPLAQRAPRVLRIPPAGRGIHLPLPRRRPQLGRGRDRRPHPPHPTPAHPPRHASAQRGQATPRTTRPSPRRICSRLRCRSSRSSNAASASRW